MIYLVIIACTVASTLLLVSAVIGLESLDYKRDLNDRKKRYGIAPGGYKNK